ncbi:MAG: hypothetical protein NC489_45125 [Ruminococcus flavefaciens]|nr:hypothetical protein [Ruminococcus flavefaciens]
MKNINLLGMKLHDRYARESLMLADRFIKKGAAHIILYLTTAALLEAARNEGEKEWIEAADATLWGDTKILEAAEISVKVRYNEVEEKEFLNCFMRKMAKNHTAILVLSDTEEHAQVLKSELIEMQNGITVVGTMAINDIIGSQENLINEINMIAPMVIIVRMPFSMQLRWLKDSRQYMNVGIWLGMPEDFSCVNKKEMPVKKVGKRILNVLFSRKVNKYRK